MAVYTQVSDQALQQLMQAYGLNGPVTSKGMAGGTENTTYKVSCENQHFILTLFEQGDHSDLDFFVQLLPWLAEKGLEIAPPLPDLKGQCLHQISDKPALLFPFLAGEHPEASNVNKGRAIGQWLARLHLAGLDFPHRKENLRSVDWMKDSAPHLMPLLDDMDQQLMQLEISHFADLLEECPDLPEGIIHGDLFRDNSFFEDDTLTGVIDFYNGCTGHLLYDLAVVINDWSCQQGSEPDMSIQQAVIQGYNSVRELSEQEQHALPGFIRACALRYWISRLIAMHLTPPGEDQESIVKDPEQYRLILQARIRQAACADEIV